MPYGIVDSQPVYANRIFGPGTAQTLNRSTFGAQRLRLQANGGFCRRVPSPKERKKCNTLGFRTLLTLKYENKCERAPSALIPTLNRSTWSEAMAPSGARPGRVFDDEGGKYGTDARASEEGACIFFRARRRRNEV